METEKITLKVARVRADLKVKEVCEKLGISRNQLYKYETGRCVPNVDVAFKLVGLYNVDINNVNFLCN